MPLPAETLVEISTVYVRRITLPHLPSTHAQETTVSSTPIIVINTPYVNTIFFIGHQPDNRELVKKTILLQPPPPHPPLPLCMGYWPNHTTLSNLDNHPHYHVDDGPLIILSTTTRSAWHSLGCYWSRTNIRKYNLLITTFPIPYTVLYILDLPVTNQKDNNTIQ